jgi:hypothetical protein
VFNEYFPDLQGHYSFFNDPVPSDISTEEFERRYLSNKLWRLNNIYTIVDKDGNPRIFRMNQAQLKVYAATRRHPRVIILKSRQQGISTLWLVSFFDDSVFGHYLSVGLMAQGADEAATLLERSKLLWDTLPDDIKGFVNVKLVKDNTKELAFSNNCTIFIRTSFRSTTLQRLHISEFAKIANANPQRAKETKTGTLQALAAGNTGVIESTAEGRNDFKTMWDNAVLAKCSGQQGPKDFEPVFLSWLDDPDCALSLPQAETGDSREYFAKLSDAGITASVEQRNFWIQQHRELEGDVYQEYPATPEEAFMASRDGTYYSRLFTEEVVRGNRVSSDLYDPNLPLDVYFDLGVDDYMVMGFVQWYRGSYRIVDDYWNNGYDLEHYIEEAESRGYDIRNYVFPHDIKVRQLVSGNGGGGRARTRLDMCREYFRNEGIQSGVRVLAKSSIADGIEAVRRMIPSLWIDPRAGYLIDCFYNYSKEWDPKLRVWKKTPLHDEYSHGADVLRSIAVGVTESAGTNDSSLAGPVRRRRASGHDV